MSNCHEAVFDVSRYAVSTLVQKIICNPMLWYAVTAQIQADTISYSKMIRRSVSAVIAELKAQQCMLS